MFIDVRSFQRRRNLLVVKLRSSKSAANKICNNVIIVVVVVIIIIRRCFVCRCVRPTIQPTPPSHPTFTPHTLVALIDFWHDQSKSMRRLLIEFLSAASMYDNCYPDWEC